MFLQLVQTKLLTYHTDIWALAICFWELFTDGKLPYLHLKPGQVVSRLAEESLQPECDPAWPITPILEKIFDGCKKSNASFCAQWLFEQLDQLKENEIGQRI